MLVGDVCEHDAFNIPPQQGGQMYQEYVEDLPLFYNLTKLKPPPHSHWQGFFQVRR